MPSFLFCCTQHVHKELNRSFVWCINSNLFLFCLDLLDDDDDDEVDEHQPFPSLSQVNYMMFISVITQHAFSNYDYDLKHYFSIITYFLSLLGTFYCFVLFFSCIKVQINWIAFFIHLPIQIFQAIPEHVGFNIELKWICQMKVGTQYGQGHNNLLN